jgi:hypothetical protein
MAAASSFQSYNFFKSGRNCDTHSIIRRKKTELHKKNMAVFRIVAPCNLVVYWRVRSGFYFPHQGSKPLWNVGKLLPGYMAQQPRKQPSSYSLLSEPQIWKSFYTRCCLNLWKLGGRETVPRSQVLPSHIRGLCLGLYKTVKQWKIKSWVHCRKERQKREGQAE